ncbi:MAG: septum formation initiator family protein [Bacteroidales bacterium]|nr:septum formation initiator family protein [Bacteroidales bacterium]
MNFFRRIFHGEHGRFFVFAAVVFVVFALILLFGKGNNLINWFQVKREIARQERQIERYNQEIKEMDRKIDMLSNDRDALEEFARETFHFSAPGEDVYTIDE